MSVSPSFEAGSWPLKTLSTCGPAAGGFEVSWSCARMRLQLGLPRRKEKGGPVTGLSVLLSTSVLQVVLAECVVHEGPLLGLQYNPLLPLYTLPYSHCLLPPTPFPPGPASHDHRTSLPSHCYVCLIPSVTTQPRTQSHPLPPQTEESSIADLITKSTIPLLAPKIFCFHGLGH